ncbi:RDD family protein [Kitasatospora sp. YST-16]|uniref:RDD family protein n=1 Tax=unclassified Kitasatospora TaxID=2633591 RepID=UPI000692171A|nr:MULTISPECIES: RDD family protein [unclassified Kitasatospora]WAL71356.1 RDD family protein [Kitasatospora sp. YST-16]WNW37393.1 RDD family protein [Streptomyces sp. Li-HN-5-13]
MSSNTPPGYGPPQDPYGSTPQGAFPGWLGPTPPPGAQPVPGTRVLAAPVDRFLARLIDAAVLIVPLIIVAVITMGSFLYYLLAAVVLVAYEGGMMLTQHGQTVGKKAMRLRVVSAATGGRPTDNELWTRAGVYGGPFLVPYIGGLFSLVNCLSLLWDKPLQQCFHDKGGKTVVVKEF